MPAVARLSLRVVPGGSRDAVEGEMADGTIKVRLRARAVEGAANEALIEFVARVLGVPRRAIRIAQGERSRRKRLEIDGLEAQEARRKMLGGKGSEGSGHY